MSGAAPAPTPFARLGGHDWFASLVASFYARVAVDPVLRPLYPDDDLAPAAERLLLFLEQYWGGPQAYSERRGHPRLRLRHAPFAIDEAAADRWVAHMRAALAEHPAPPELAAEVDEYFARAAQAMVNVG